MSAHRLTMLDVFTDVPLAGNGLAVVHGADAVPDAVMHAYARETRLSETSFIQAGGHGADYRHRIWMMGGEIPFAGHPSLGAAVAVARERDATFATYVQRTQAGLQPIEIELDGLRARASMHQEPPRFGPELDPGEVLAVVGLDAADADPRLPVQVVSTGVPQVVAAVRDGDAIERAQPDYARIEPLLRAYDAIVLYLAVVDAATGGTRARGFCRTAEEGEDPATGSAAGPLCAQVHARLGVDALDIAQGVEMGRPSRLAARIEDDRVRVGGDVLVIAEGTLHLP